MPAATLTPDAATRLAIEDLLARAAYALDEREDAMLSACFTADAVFVLRIADGDPLGPFEGREGIMGLMRNAWAEHQDRRRHVVSNVFFPAASAATVPGAIPVISYLTLMATENDVVRLLCTGCYRDEVVDTGDGWQLARRHLQLEKSY